MEGHLSNHPRNAPQKGPSVTGFREEICPKPNLVSAEASHHPPNLVGHLGGGIAFGPKKSSCQNLWGCQPFFPKMQKKGDKFCNLGFFGVSIFLFLEFKVSQLIFFWREKFGTSDKPSPRLLAHKHTRITLPKTKLTASLA